MEKKNGATDPSDHKAAGERHSPSTKTAAHKDGHAAPASDDVHKTPKKRRKVNHACVYCRRSHMTCDLERPCTRCIKRNIGHLCHDEPRDADTKKIKSTSGGSAVDEMDAQASSLDVASVATPTLMRPPSFDATASSAAAKSGFNAGALGTGRGLQLVPPSPIAGMQQPAAMNSGNMNQFAGFSDAWLTAQNHLHDMHSYNPNYMIAPEVTNEFNLLNDFLHSSLLDDGVLDDQSQLLRSGTQSDMLSGFPNSGDNNGDSSNNLLPPPASSAGSMLPPGAELGKGIQRPASVVPIDKARAFYFQAADPTGNDSPEERMNRVLRAKYDAGLLKPFNYIKGYARLHQYLDSHKVAPASKQSIKRQLDKFRPKFREKMQALTDMELLYVEMWFEKTLLEYDRVFSSMAVPACCWRRTGEIFRGNKEMAELIHVPVERLRDGKIALHEILTEESMVRYWEEFGTVAFDPDHDALLTACALKNPDDQSNDPIVRCCFALKIRRDDHKIPSLIIGNFLPHNPKPHE